MKTSMSVYSLAWEMGIDRYVALRCASTIHIFIRMYSLGLGEEYPSRECAHNNILTKRYNSIWGPYAIRSTYELGHAKVVRYPGVCAMGKASSARRRWTEILNVLIWLGNLSCWLIVFAFRFTRTITHECVCLCVWEWMGQSEKKRTERNQNKWWERRKWMNGRRWRRRRSENNYYLQAMCG